MAQGLVAVRPHHHVPLVPKTVHKGLDKRNDRTRENSAVRQQPRLIYGAREKEYVYDPVKKELS